MAHPQAVEVPKPGGEGLMPDIKLIALDLDGTLLDSRKHLSAGNLAALEQAAAQGIHIVPATGRFYAGMPEAVRALPFLRYMIAVNGAQVCDLRTGDVLYRAEIPCAQALEVLDDLAALPGIYDCYVDGCGYMSRTQYERAADYIREPGILQMVLETRRPVEDLAAFLAAGARSPQKIQMFFRDMDRRALELQRLPKRFPELVITTALTNNVEINAWGAQKGTALEMLCGHLGLECAQAMAIGDGLNDRSMLRAAGIGVAMGNAPAEVQREADFVTAANDADGVAAAIRRFCL